MSLQPRDRRAIAFLAVSVILGLVYRFWPATSAPSVPAPMDSVAFAEKRLARLREIAATVPAKEEILRNVSAELAAREKGLIVADTAAQAQAQLIQMLRRLGAAETPPVEIRATEGFGIRPLGDSYGEASVAVQIECHIEQLVNLLAALASQPELISPSDMRITSANAKDKTIGVHLNISGVVPRKLVPEKRGVTAF
jgi:hypothetical protein